MKNLPIQLAVILTARAEMRLCRCWGETLPSSMRQCSRQPMLMQFKALPGNSQSPAVHGHLPANTAVATCPTLLHVIPLARPANTAQCNCPCLVPWMREVVKHSSAALLARSPPESSTRPTSCSTLTLQGMGHLCDLLLKHEPRDSSTSMHHVPPGVRLRAPQCRAPDHTAHDLLSATQRPQGKEDPSALTMCTQACSTQALT